jgi:hypothetical protein
VDEEGIAAMDKDEQLRPLSQRDEHEQEEGEEQFSPCSILLCGQIGNSCCI